MADEPVQPEIPRRITWRTLFGVLFPGNRDGDRRLRRYGLTAVVTVSLLAMVRDTLHSEREDRRRETDLLRDYMAEQTIAIKSAMVEVTSELRSLSGRMDSTEITLAGLQGLAAGHYQCPPPKVCPLCPKPLPCPSVTCPSVELSCPAPVVHVQPPTPVASSPRGSGSTEQQQSRASRER